MFRCAAASQDILDFCVRELDKLAFSGLCEPAVGVVGVGVVGVKLGIRDSALRICECTALNRRRQFGTQRINSDGGNYVGVRPGNWVLRAELMSHFWLNCDCRDLGLFFGVLAELI